MKTVIYRLLNTHSKDWWYHVELRQRGNVQEARKRERDSIKGYLKDIREAIAHKGYVHIGEYGTSLYISDNSRIECQWQEEFFVDLAHACGLPVLDTRPIPYRDRYQTINFPMVGLDKTDPQPWTSFSAAPMAHVFDLYKQAGAVIS